MRPKKQVFKIFRGVVLVPLRRGNDPSADGELADDTLLEHSHSYP